MAVLFFPEETDCIDGEQRLISESGGTVGQRSGRLEICYQGVWGAVYDTSWTARDASVACQEMGFDPRGTDVARAYNDVLFTRTK